MTRSPDEVLTSLSLAQKAMLTSGEGPWRTPAIPAAGVYPLKLTDGSHGARGDHFHGTQSVCFPCGSALGATFDVELAYEMGRALAREARRKQAHVLLGPTLNLHRYPLGGRNFESFGEDPHLVGSLAVGYIRGLQGQGVAAVPQHLVANDCEIERETVDVVADEATLREVFLVPFERAVRDAGAWAIMTAYSKLNGTYCSEHPWLIGEVLKGEWRFDGLVISDWGGVNSVAAAARAGLDLEMPGPPDFFGERLLEAVETGGVTEEHIDDKALRVLRLARRTGALRGAPGPESSANEASDQRLVRRLGHESIVLLRNSGALPLDAEKLQSIAVIGPHAARTQIQGGGSARVNAPYAVSVLDGIRAAISPDTEVVHAEGCSIDRFTRPLGRAEMRTPEGLPGARLDYLQGAERTLVRSETVDSTELTWIGAPLDEVPLHETRLRCSFTWSPASSGAYTLGLIAAGRATVTIDGEVLLDSAHAAPGGSHFFGRSTQELRRPLDVSAGREYVVVIDLETRTEKSATVGVRLGALPPAPERPLAAAVTLARRADVAVVVVGTGPDWEMEGGDRPQFALPGAQAELVRQVAAVNPHTIVVVNAGAAVDLPFSEEVDGLLYAWFGGQEMGHAVAEVLFGKVDPGGRLPMSIPREASEMLDLNYRGGGGPGWGADPAHGGTLRHAERGLIGYRHHAASGLPARFTFGEGLSYARIEISDLAVEVPNGSGLPISVRLLLTNHSRRVGTCVPQVYVTAPGGDAPRRLVGFAKYRLAALQSLAVTIQVRLRDLAEWSVMDAAWQILGGQHRFEVGESAAVSAVGLDVNLAPAMLTD